MPIESFSPTQGEIERSREGLFIQAEAYGLDTEDKKVIGFLLHAANVIASYQAQVRWLDGIIVLDDTGEE